MDLSSSPGRVTVARLMSGVACGCFLVVGAWELRGAPWAALLSLAGLAFAAAIGDAWLEGEFNRGTLRRVATRTTSVALGLTAAVGAIALLDDLELLYAAAALVVWWKLGIVPRWRSEEQGSAVPREDLEGLVRTLDGPALAQMWAKCQATVVPPGSAESVRMSLIRQAVLDELDRRDPAGFAAWLERGAPVDDPPVAGRPEP